MVDLPVGGEEGFLMVGEADWLALALAPRTGELGLLGMGELGLLRTGEDGGLVERAAAGLLVVVVVAESTSSFPPPLLVAAAGK